MRKNIILAGLLIGSTASAQVHKIDVKKELSGTVVDLYQVTSEKKKVKLSPLSQLKDYEIHLKWAECSKLAPQVFNARKDLRGWVATSWLHCLEGAQNKVKNQAAVDKALSAMEAHKDLLQEGPWSANLAKSYVSLKLSALEDQVSRKVKTAVSGIDSLLGGSYTLNKDQRGRVYQLLGDLALLDNNYAEAQFFYEQAQDQRDSKYLQDKLDFISRTKVTVVAPTKPTVTVPEVSGEESKLEERVAAALKQNDPISALKDSIQILNEYPGSRAARRLKDKPLEIYNSLSEKLVRVKALNEMEEADTQRLMDWAQNLHRRADYAGSMSLALKAMEKNPAAPSTTSALWIAGRSAHFLGQYDRALDLYKKLFTNHLGSEEAAEALFRSGLIYYRKKEFTNASALLERLLQQGRERYELNGQYWLVRSFQASKSDRAKQAAADLMDRFPFSYYGLRLRAEAQEGKLTWPDNKDKIPALTNEFYVVGAQKSAWLRFKSLSESGWVSEAQEELSFMPFMKDATLKVNLAEKMMERQQYVTAIRWINEAMESDPRLRREQFVKISYPEAFSSLYQAEAERYGVDAVLFKSLTRQESAFNLKAVSTSNALGLMQMIPPTAQEVSRKLGMKVELPDDMFRPEVNIPMGSFYISQMLDQFQGSVPFALAAYNAGPYRMKLWMEGRTEVGELVSKPSSEPLDELWFDELPWTETSFYVKAILRNVLLYRLSEKGNYAPNPVLWQDLLIKKAK